MHTEQQFDATQSHSQTVGAQPRPGTPPATPAFTRTRAPKRLYRNPDGPIAGVATGIADYLGIDPVITRIAFLLAALSGFGFAAYLVCWVVMPRGERPRRRLPLPGSLDSSN